MNRLVAVLVLTTLPFLTEPVRRLPRRTHLVALSVAAGISVSYVVVELLPKLAESQAKVDGHGFLPYLERHVYLLALVGLVVAYAVERFARSESATSRIFSLASITAAMFLVAYSITTRDDTDIEPLALFTFALGLHYFVVDEALAERLGPMYRDVGRYVVAAGCLAGAGLGALMQVDEAAIALVLAFLAGGVILHTVRHELPDGGGTGNFAAFALGAAAYTAVLLA